MESSLKYGIDRTKSAKKPTQEATIASNDQEELPSL